MFDQDRPGCAQCQPPQHWQRNLARKEGIETLVEYKECRNAIKRIAFYQYDRVHRCDKCKTLWLHQRWEIDTEETKYEEWGKSYRLFIALSKQDYADIKAAITSEEIFKHDAFRDGRHVYDFGAKAWFDPEDK